MQDYLCSVSLSLSYIFVVISPGFWFRFLQCFDAVGWVAGMASDLKNWVVRYWHGYPSGARCK